MKPVRFKTDRKYDSLCAGVILCVQGAQVDDICNAKRE
jgi:hypothetical protein